MEYNGYSFRDKLVRENTKYIVITDGDLDINNAYGIESDTELELFISKCGKECSKSEIQAIFKIEVDVTDIHVDC